MSGYRQLCPFHSSHGPAEDHPNATQWAKRLIAAQKAGFDCAPLWEQAYTEFADCDACMDEQLVLLAHYAATGVTDD